MGHICFHRIWKHRHGSAQQKACSSGWGGKSPAKERGRADYKQPPASHAGGCRRVTPNQGGERKKLTVVFLRWQMQSRKGSRLCRSGEKGAELAVKK